MSALVSREEVNRILKGCFGEETEQLVSRIIELELALRPFAEAYERFDNAALEMGFAPAFDEYRPKTRFTHGDLRAARKACYPLLSKQEIPA